MKTVTREVSKAYTTFPTHICGQCRVHLMYWSASCLWVLYYIVFILTLQCGKNLEHSRHIYWPVHSPYIADGQGGMDNLYCTYHIGLPNSTSLYIAPATVWEVMLTYFCTIRSYIWPALIVHMNRPAILYVSAWWYFTWAGQAYPTHLASSDCTYEPAIHTLHVSLVVFYLGRPGISYTSGQLWLYIWTGHPYPMYLPGGILLGLASHTPHIWPVAMYVHWPWLAGTHSTTICHVWGTGSM